MRTCEDCGYHKTYVNHRKMEELKTDTVIWYENCQHQDMPSEIEDMEMANSCEYYDDDSWMK